MKLAVLYLVIGVLTGTAMGATQNFTLRPVHAHVNLLGRATLALAGLAIVLLGNPGLEPLVGLASVGAVFSVLVFAANLFMNLKK